MSLHSKQLKKSTLPSHMKTLTVRDLLNKFSKTVMYEKVMGHPIIGEVAIPCGETLLHGKVLSMSANGYLDKSQWVHGALSSRAMVESVKEAIMTTKEMRLMLELYATAQIRLKIVFETALNLEQGTGSVTVHLTPSLT